MANIMFHPAMPDYCPPKQGTSAAKGKVFRAIPELPICADHFKSKIEMGYKSYKPAKCESWGLSVWVTEKAVHHARKIMPSIFSKQYIVQTDLQPSDGVIMPTPSQTQPEHFTFWVAHGLDLSPRSSVAFEPAP